LQECYCQLAACTELCIAAAEGIHLRLDSSVETMEQAVLSLC